MAKLTEKEKAKVAQVVKHAKLIEGSRKVARMIRHTNPPPEVCAFRDDLETRMPDWLRHHGGEAFDRPWSGDHLRVLGKIGLATLEGGTVALAMPRGEGKTTILKWVCLYILMTGRRKYVVIVAATGEMGQVLVEFCRQQITESDSLHEHYPHVTTYARATDGKAIKARFQLRADGKSSGIEWSKNTLVFPDVLDPDTAGTYPSNGAILEGHGLTGAIRGKWKDTKTGKVLRPDFVLLDDPQTRESGESDSQCDQRERIITGDILGLAGPKKRIAAIMPCTVIRKGDLAHRFLDHSKHPEWQGETCRLVNKWPDAQETLWAKYAEVYRDAISDGRGMAEATELYQANREAMDAGAEVSSEFRIRDGEISALQTAQNLRIESGDQFWAEYQNDPLEQGAGLEPYTLTTDLIASRQDDRPAFTVPPWCVIKIASTDMNPSYALTSAIVGFGRDQTAAVLWYGLFTVAPLPIPADLPSAERHRRVFDALVAHGKQLSAAPCCPESWHIDASGEYFPTVMRFSERSVALCGIQAIGSTGVGSKNYRVGGKSMLGQAREYCQMRSDVADGHRRKWFAWQADHWKEIAQRAWLGEVGSPGSVSLFRGNHGTFADQVAREKLRGKGDVGGQTIWNWATAPGPHDYGDVMAQAFAAAAWGGISTSGPSQRPAKYVEVRRCKVARQN